ncbi:MAG: hypothetical protein ACYTGL_14770 [Planctomycetota bacterium]|jgi:hypothetical protein
MRHSSVRQLLDAMSAHEGAGNRQGLEDEIRRLITRGNQSVRVIVRNDSGSAVGRGSILGIEDVLLSRSANEAAWPGDLNFKGSIPRKHHRSFVVTEEPIPAGLTGQAVFEGHCVVKLRYRAGVHGFANPVIEETDHLETASTGWARIFEVDKTDRINDETGDDDEYIDPVPIYWAAVYLNPLVNGHPVGDVVQGKLVKDISAASWRSMPAGPSAPRREATVSLLQVWDVDPDNELIDQARYQYPVVDWTPWSDDAEDAGDPHNEIVIGYDLRNGSLIQEHWPLTVYSSTGRNGVWTVDADWSSDDRWDAVNARYRIPIKEKIPSVLEPEAAPAEVELIDGVVIVPGASMWKATDRYELVVNRRGISAALNAWAEASWNGAEYVLDHVSC